MNKIKYGNEKYNSTFLNARFPPSIYLSICRLYTLRVVFSGLHCYITCVFVFLFCDIGISYTRLELIYYYFMLT